MRALYMMMISGVIGSCAPAPTPGPPGLSGGFVDITPMDVAAGATPVWAGEELVSNPSGVATWCDFGLADPVVIMSGRQPGFQTFLPSVEEGLEQGEIIRFLLPFSVSSGELVPLETATALLAWRTDHDHPVPRPTVTQLACVDLDGDGVDEVFVASNEQLLYRFTDDDFQWVDTFDLAAPDCPNIAGNPAALGVDDINQDGKLDLLVTALPPQDPGCDQYGSLAAYLQTTPLTFAFHDLIPGTPVVQSAGFAFPRKAPSTAPGIVISGSDPLESGTIPDAILWPQSGFNADLGYTSARTIGTDLYNLTPMGAELAWLDDGDCQYLLVSVTADLLRVYQACDYGVAAVWFDVSRQMDIAIQTDGSDQREIPWGMRAFDIDRDGCRDVVVNNAHDALEFTTGTGAAYNETRAYWNANCGASSDTGEDIPRFEMWPSTQFGDLPGAPIDATFDYEGTGLVCADLDADGDMDCLLVGANGAGPRLLINAVQTEGHGLTVALRGTTSNAHGIGAHVSLTSVNGRSRCQMGAASNDSAWGSPMCDFGLGSSTSGELEVHWPTGFVHNVGTVLAGALHTISEPPVLTVGEVEEADNGGLSVRAKVCPFQPNGKRVDRAAVVEVTVDNHDGADAAPVFLKRRDGCRIYELTNSDDVGHSAVRASISYDDGTDLDVAVRPRVFWGG